MSDRRSHLLPRLSLDRPVSVIMILLAIMVVGAIAYTRIPLSLFPRGMENPRLYVWVSMAQSTPSAVEKDVTRPLEDAIATIPRLSQVRSRSHHSGAWLSIEFEPNTDLGLAYAEISDRVERVKPLLPDDVERVQVRHWGEEDMDIVFGAASVPGASLQTSYEVLDEYFRPRVERIDGVSNVGIHGPGWPEVAIDIDQEKARAHKIDLYGLVSQLRRSNFNLPSGWIIDGERKLFVRSLAKFESVDQIAETIIDADSGLRLRDIATVEMEQQRGDRSWRVNQVESIGFWIVKSSDGNPAEISQELQLLFEELKDHPVLGDVEYELFWDQGRLVIESVDNLKSSALWGGIFAAMVLFLFLRNVRMTLIISLAIPLCILTVIIALYFIGWTLNAATMMGLMLSLGLVVDNAIVIVENIYRKRQEGADRRHAAIEGAGEVGLAVTMATLTTVVVFLPLILMNDNPEFSFWMLRIGMPVIIGLLASLFISLAIIPLAAERLGRSRQVKSPSGFLVRLRERYVDHLRWVLNHRLDASLICLAVVLSMQFPASHVKQEDRSRGDDRRLRVEVGFPDGYSFEQCMAYVKELEALIEENRDRYNVRTYDTWTRRHEVDLDLIFHDPPYTAWYAVAFDNLLKTVGLRESPYLSYDEVSKELRDVIEIPPGFRLEINWQEDPQGGGVARNSIYLYGDDTATLAELANEAERRLRSIEGVLSVTSSASDGNFEVGVRVDRDLARRYNVDPRTVGGTIGYALRGTNVSRYAPPGEREIDIQVRFEEDDRKSIEQLANLAVLNRAGEEVPLESFSTFDVYRVARDVDRENRQTFIRLETLAPEEDKKKMFGAIDEVMAGFVMPEGYQWNKGVRLRNLERDSESQKFALILAVTFVFLLMGVLFESFLLPLSVIVSIPLAFVGVYWTLWITGTNYDIMARIGTVILIGVVVNNAIVLIDLANRLRSEGMERTQALLEAGGHRFRPILMTTFTTLFGLIPMAVGNAAMIGMSYAPLGRTMMGGLLASTFLTLLAVPLFYTFFDDLRVAGLALMKRIGGAEPAGAAEPATDQVPAE